MPALIVAFDGVVADTLPLRAHALADAAAAEFQPRTIEQALAVLPGRNLLEAALSLFPDEATRDPTLPELVALRAQRGFRQLVQHGAPVHAGILREIHDAAASGTRVVLRADSERRDVEPLLAMAGLDHQFTFTRCSDDMPRGHDPSLLRSWQAVDARLRSMQQDVMVRTAWEMSGGTESTARSFVASVRSFPLHVLD